MIAIAASPFDRTDADVVLRTSDQVDFHVYKSFLSEASEFFKSTFRLPQPAEHDIPPSELKDGVPVIPMPKTSKILENLLRFCYPTPNPTFDKVADVYAMLLLAEKYDMEGVKEECLRALMDPKILEVEPFSVYAIAHSLGREEETRKAARMTLRFHFPKNNPPIGISRISGGALFALVDYRTKCKSAVSLTLNDVVNVDDFAAEGKIELSYETDSIDTTPYYDMARRIFASHP